NLPVTVEIYVEAHGSSTGFKGLLSGEADIAASSRPIKKKEEIKLIKEGDMRSLQNEHIVAIDGLAIVVHPNNKISQLSTQSIKDIFTGKITRWSQLGGSNKAIRVLARDDKSGTYDTFKGLILRKTSLVKNAERYESNDEISRQVSMDPDAIGFVALASIGKDKPLQVSDGKALALTPNTLTIATEDYPLSRRLYFYSRHKSKNNFAVNQFLDFIKSDKGQAVVDQTGFIAQSLFPLEVEDNPEWQRLNMNIRFQEGSSALDNKAAIDVSRLVEFINRPENQYMQVKLVGYSNPTDSNANPDAVSRIRAQNVRWALRSNGLANKVKTEAGTTMSVADPESINANKNRRVEVWVQ
ncbi:MAG: substrate-binding domain-containing protein, partial [Pseudomonadales bacterium]|nr:substrate-binding domain-containing protein [Pseudomonadales bacterium]